MTLLKTESLSFSYEKGQPLLFENLDFGVKQGEFLAVVGPSGSGKSTLLRLLAGHLKPTNGKIYFHDEEIEGPDVRLVPGYDEIKLVYQQFELRPNISARENILAVLNEYNREYRIERVAFLLSFLGLEPYANHRPYELSGGQQQRLAIAKAMANEPEVLLMDEPFSALDPMSSSIFLKEVKRLAAETGTSIVLVTHDTRDALMADNIVVLMNGVVRQIGTPQEIYFKPSDVEVASFFGPINHLSSEESKLIDSKLDGPMYLRAESLIPVEWREGLTKFHIKEIVFRGAYQILIISLSKEKEVLAFDFQRRFKPGAYVSLNILSNELVNF